MPTNKSDLGIISDGIRESYTKRRNDEEAWFASNPPTKEFFVIAQDGEKVHYGVWPSVENDFMVIFKTPDEKYHFKYKTFVNKVMVKELYDLLEESEK